MRSLRVSAHGFPDYEQYYASLAASAAASAQATPSGLSAPGSDFDDFGEDEEDRKPSIEYLNSLNDYRKRSRSQEDEGSTGRNKLAKSDSSMNVDAHADVPADVEMDASAAPKDDPLVYGTPVYFIIVCWLLTASPVNGKPILFSKVTEEDHELMTPEEYTAYFEAMQSLEE